MRKEQILHEANLLWQQILNDFSLTPSKKEYLFCRLNRFYEFLKVQNIDFDDAQKFLNDIKREKEKLNQTNNKNDIILNL